MDDDNKDENFHSPTAKTRANKRSELALREYFIDNKEIVSASKRLSASELT